MEWMSKGKLGVQESEVGGEVELASGEPAESKQMKLLNC